MWTFVCLIFVTYYSGSLTSVVIRPPPDDRFTTIEELRENNYSICFTNPTVRILVGELLTHELAIKTRNSSTEKRLNILAEMVPSAKIFPGFYSGHNETYLLGDKLAGFGFSAGAFTSADRMRAYLKQAKMPDIRCYVGEQEMLVKIMFYHITPVERSSKLRDIFFKLFEGGFVYFWWKEFNLAIVYGRVQDRPNFSERSFTKLPEEKIPWKPQRFSDGKFKQIFVLWGICLLTSLLLINAENIWHCYQRLAFNKVVTLSDVG